MTKKEQRDEHLIQRVKNEQDTPLSKIASDAGISLSRVHQIMKDYGVSRKKKRRERTPYHMMEPVSRLHHQIGQDVAYHKSRLGLSADEFGARAKLSRQRLRAIELGVMDDLTVTEIVRLSRACEVTVEQLTTERTASRPREKEAS